MASRPEMEDTQRLDRELFAISEIFHENTKIRRLAGTRFRSNGMVESQPLLGELRYATLHAWKVYRAAKTVPLPRDTPPVDQPVETALRARCSTREYSGTPISLEQLSSIAGLAYGVVGTAPLDDEEHQRSRRAAPSAGALYPVELYTLALAVDLLDEGLYHYQPRDHSLECLQVKEWRDEIERAVVHPEVVHKAAAVFILTAVFHRARFKYGERGYRFALLDTGHVAQNIWLVATALGLNAVAIGGFYDDDLNKITGVNGVDEGVVYLVAVGQPVAERVYSPSAEARRSF